MFYNMYGQFNPMAWQVCSPDPFSALNLQWNDGMMKLQLNNLLFTTMPGGNMGFTPLSFSFDSSMNYLLDPRYSIAQFQQSMNNGWNGFGNFGNFGGGFGNFGNWGNPWANPWGNNGGGNGGGGSSTTTEGKQVNTLKNIIGSAELSEEHRKEYQEALKKSTDAEKLTALKELIKKLSDTEKKAIKNKIAENADVKKALEESVIDYNKTAEKDNVDRAYSGLDRDDISGMLAISMGDDKYTLPDIGYWNYKHPNTHILKAISDKLPNDKIKVTNYADAITNLTTKLITKANKYDSDGISQAKVDALSKQLGEVSKYLGDRNNSNAGYNKSKAQAEIAKLIPLFNALYVEIRMIQAQKSDKEIKEKFGIFEELMPGTLPNIEAKTKEQLTNVEKISSLGNYSHIREDENYVAPQNTVDEDFEGDPDGALAALANGNESGLTDSVIKPSSKSGVFETLVSTTKADKKYYTKQGDKIVELKDVKGISADGTCTMKDGSKKPLAQVNKVEVSAQDIQDYQSAVNRVEDLFAQGLLKMGLNGANKTYMSTVKQAGGASQHFLIKDNKLVMLANGWIGTDGKCHVNSKVCTIDQLTSADVREFDANEIVTASNQSSQTPASGNTQSQQTSSGASFSKEDAYGKGRYLATDLIGYTNDEEYERIKKTLSQVNKDNVIELLKGYYSNGSGGNGLFLQLALESTKFKNSVVKPVAQALLDAIPAEYQDTEQYKLIRAIVNRIKENKDSDDFKMLNGDWGWGWNRIFGLDDLDQLDDAIEELLKMMTTTTTTD